jgi:hypothetical protein
VKPLEEAYVYDYGVLREVDWSRMFNPGGLKNLHKHDYEKLAQAVANTADPIRRALSADGGATTRQIVEIIAAQIGLVLGADNKSFDSFRFVEAIEKNVTK